MHAPRFHFLQHVPFEGLAYIEKWLNQHQYPFSGTLLHESQALPGLDTFDILIVMGGPMGIYDDKTYPWLEKERAFIKQAVQAGKKTLGICLGSQFLADALGARVYQNEEKEIGWYPVNFDRFYRHIKAEPVQDPGPVPFHWHGDTFDIPANATCLASTAPTPNQAFIFDNRVIGLQFHLELEKENVLSMLENCASDITPSAFVQEYQNIVDNISEENIQQNLILMSNIMDYLVKL